VINKDVGMEVSRLKSYDLERYAKRPELQRFLPLQFRPDLLELPDGLLAVQAFTTVKANFRVDL
jgi:hypothetical protein